MDRMKKIKRQLSMTLRGGRGIDKTNGAPEQISLDESGGGGGSDLGQAPNRAAPGEPRSGRGPLTSAPGGSTDHSYPQTGPQVLPSSPVPLRLVFFSFSFLHFFPLPCHPLSTPFLCLSVPLLLALCPGPREEGCLACQSCPKLPFVLLLHSVMASSGLQVPTCPGLPSKGLWLPLPVLGPASVSVYPWNQVLH